MAELTFFVLQSGKVFLDGVEFEVPYVAELKKKYKSKVKVIAKKIETATRSKALGAVEDNIETIVDVKITTDHIELTIDVPLDVEIEVMEKVRNSPKGW